MDSDGCMWMKIEENGCKCMKMDGVVMDTNGW